MRSRPWTPGSFARDESPGSVVFSIRQDPSPAGDRAFVFLAGEVDLSVSGAVLDVYDQAIASMRVPRLYVDVSAVTFMDSSGLSALAVAVKRARARGGSVSVVGAGQRVRRLLHIVHLDDLITVLPSGRDPRRRASAQRAG
jgi:anti-sigma B factor antagonist